MAQKQSSHTTDTGAASSHAPILTQVIAFQDATYRREMMQARLAKHGLTPTFIDAVDGRALCENERKQYLDPERSKWLGHHMSAGALGCCLAHMKAWQSLLDSGESCALILEDDAVLSDEARPVLDALVSKAENFDIVTLYQHKPRPRHVIDNLTSSHTLSVVRYNQIGAIAYVMSRNAAERLLAAARPITFEVDVFMNRWWQHGVCNMLVYPPIATEDGRDSSIGYSRPEPKWSHDTLFLNLQRRINRGLDSFKKRLRFKRYVQSILTRWHKT